MKSEMPQGRRGGLDWDHLLHRLEAAVETGRQLTKLTPERARDILEERSRRLARVQSDDERTDDALEVLTFTIGNENFAIETRFVRVVAPFHDFTPVPGVPAHFLGVTKLEGEVLALVDLRRLFGMPIRGLSDLARVVVLGQEQAEFGLLAAATEEVTFVSNLAPAPSSIRDADRACLRGVTSDAASVLDGNALLADPRLFVDQSEVEIHALSRK